MAERNRRPTTSVVGRLRGTPLAHRRPGYPLSGCCEVGSRRGSPVRPRFRQPLPKPDVRLSTSSGFPVAHYWFRIGSAIGITPTWPVLTPSNLSPFALWPAFPTADYYEDSVALGVAPRGSISCCTGSSRASAV